MRFSLLDLIMVWVGFSTMIWMGEFSNYLAKRQPKLLAIGIFPVLISIFSTVIYILLTYAKLLPSGISTLVFSLDSAVGMTFVVSATGLISFFLLFPIVKILRELLPPNTKNEISFYKQPPTKGIGLAYFFFVFITIGLTTSQLLPIINKFLFGECTLKYEVLCSRLSIFTLRFADYISTAFLVNEQIGQVIAFLGAIASIGAIIQAGIEIYNFVNGDKSSKKIERAKIIAMSKGIRKNRNL